jgi:hypothetical protein
MRRGGRQGAVLATVLLLCALLWSLLVVLLLVASTQHAIAHASRDRAAALAVVDELLAARRGQWMAWLDRTSPQPPENEEGGGEACSWRVTIDEATEETVRATVSVTLGRAAVRIGATAHAP